MLTLIAAGLSNSEIAAELVVSDATVKTHVNHVLQKLAFATAFRPSFSPTKSDSCGPAAAPKWVSTWRTLSGRTPENWS